MASAADATMSSGVVWEAVEYTYPVTPPVVAVRPTDLILRPGEQVALVGPSGSGKSTALNVLGLLDRPSAGRYRLFGRETSELNETDRSGMRAAQIGFVFQSFHLLPRRSSVENVALGMLYGPVPRHERRSRALATLRRVGLGHRVDAPAATLSGGERQRVAIARALSHNPCLLLADEPTGNLDQPTGQEIMTLLDELMEPALLQVIVTHDYAVAERCGRVLQIIDGVIAERS